jgi:hypothetical protein
MCALFFTFYVADGKMKGHIRETCVVYKLTSWTS